jgi:hypothetical protein
MTEAEWLACDDLLRMVTYIACTASDRKVRLYGCACCQRLGSLLTDERSRRAVEVAELFAESRVGNSELEAVRMESLGAIRFVSGQAHGSSYERRAATQAAEAAAKITGRKVQKVICDVVTAAINAIAEAAGLEGARVGAYATYRHAQQQTAVVAFTTFLTDIFGNPFCPVTFTPEWRTDTVLALARQMYESRDFGAMPILGDALQDAGCDSAEILDHCRGDGPHVRGCWVVDLVLGKE